MLFTSGMVQARIVAGALAAALAGAASPALADGAASDDAAAQSAGKGALANLTPVLSWDDEPAGGDIADDVLARLSAREAGGTMASLGDRRRPGLFSSSGTAPAETPASVRARPGARFASGMPVASGTMTSGFGLRRHPLLGDLRVHHGIDLAAPVGSPVMATADGTVSTARWAGGYGLLVAVEHGAGRQTRYAHLSRLAVAAGQRVRKGDVIGFVGSTGRSTGPHLHYETRVNGQAVNPRR